MNCCKRLNKLRYDVAHYELQRCSCRCWSSSSNRKPSEMIYLNGGPKLCCFYTVHSIKHQTDKVHILRWQYWDEAPENPFIFSVKPPKSSFTAQLKSNMYALHMLAACIIKHHSICWVTRLYVWLSCATTKRLLNRTKRVSPN